MKVKSIPRTAVRDRGEWARATAMTVPGAGKFAETAAFATAAGVATLGILHAREAHSADGGPAGLDRDRPPVVDERDRPTADASKSVLDGTDAHHAPHGTMVHETPHAGEPAHAGTAQHAPAIDTLPASPVPLSTANEPNLHTARLPDNPDIASHSSAEMPPATTTMQDDVVSRLAEHITSSVGNVLAAIQQGNVDAIGQTLAQDIFHTAGSIVQDIRTQLPDIATTAQNATSLIPTAINASLSDISGVGHHLTEAISDIGVLDVLNGNVGFDTPAQQPLHGLVGELTGASAMTVTALAADVAATAADIPASLLGGTEPGHGLLTQIFYDDGGNQSVSGGATHAIPAAEPADLGFLGQPLSTVDELTGIYHGSSALHLV